MTRRSGRGRSAPRRTPADGDAEHAWIDDPAAFDRLVDELTAVDRIALDTEFHRERTYWPRLALVQVAYAAPGSGEHRVALVDPLSVDLARFAEVLDSGATIVVHACSQDVEVLHQHCGTIPARLFDTQVAAGLVGMTSVSLSALVHRFVGVRLAKGTRLENWLVRPLPAPQRRYAALDVAFLLRTHDALTARLDELGRLAWALEECERARRPPPPPPDPELAWHRIKGARHLRGAELAVAAELAAWRERTARRLDVPPRFVLSDMALLTISQRRPAGHDELAALRGVDAGQLRSAHGTAVLDAVRAGLRTPPEQVRRPQLPDGPELPAALSPAVPLVHAWIDEVARREGIDRATLARRSDVVELLSGRERALLSTGWRASVLGDDIMRLVQGSAALLFDPAAGLRLTVCETPDQLGQPDQPDQPGQPGQPDPLGRPLPRS